MGTRSIWALAIAFLTLTGAVLPASADIVWERPAGSERTVESCSEAKIQGILNSAKAAIDGKKCKTAELTYNRLQRCYDVSSRQIKLQLDEPLRDIEQFIFTCISARWRERGERL